MIVFHNNGKITGYQTFPASYSGPEAHITVPDGTSLANKKVLNGALVAKSQEELTAETASAEAEALTAWRNTCEVTRRQAIIALYNLDSGATLTAVQAAVDAAGGITKIEWDNALTFKRMNSTVLALGAAMGWTSAQLDDLFQAAEQVPQ